VDLPRLSKIAVVSGLELLDDKEVTKPSTSGSCRVEHLSGGGRIKDNTLLFPIP
jgi:hypothetical protein